MKELSTIIRNKEENIFTFLKQGHYTSYFFQYLFNKAEEQNWASIHQDKFKLEQNDSKHLRIQHEIDYEVNSSNKKYIKEHKCTYENCNKSYRSKENLNLHIKNYHFKEKPYKCTYCLSRFSHRNGRIYHERKNHTSFLPYKCTYLKCIQSFPCKSAMMAHMKSVHLNMKKEKTNQ